MTMNTKSSIITALWPIMSQIATMNKNMALDNDAENKIFLYIYEIKLPAKKTIKMHTKYKIIVIKVRMTRGVKESCDAIPVINVINNDILVK